MNNSGRSNINRDELYIKILIISTALMLLVVLTVFVMAGGIRKNAVTPDTAPSDSTTIPDTSDNGIPVDVPPRSYLAISDDSTLIMDKKLLNADYAVLVSISDNKVIASYRADQKIYPASMTKVMTIIVAVENIKNLDDTFTMTREIVDRAVLEGASRAGFEPGETVTMLDLLYGAALPSGADATDALAIAVAGSEKAFAELMNKKAKEIGLTSTNFVNASGLHDDNHYSTAREIAAIMAYAMENELIAQILSAKSYTTSPTAQHPNGITLYNNVFTRIKTTTFGSVTLTATKTGYTPEAGNCLVSYAVGADGKGYILVTASGSSREMTYADCEYAYTTFIT